MSDDVAAAAVKVSSLEKRFAESLNIPVILYKVLVKKLNLKTKKTD